MLSAENIAFKAIKDELPNQPGVYKYFNDEGTILYVGKAINLKKRVGSYFNKQHDNQRIQRMVGQIAKIEYTIVDSEKDALLLENALIKQCQPKYNILLKDDKTYPWICITNEAFPKVYITRQKLDLKATYYGPFTAKERLWDMLDFFKQLFHYRTCNLALNEKNISNKKFKVCLEYHIGNCKAPCVAFQSAVDYNESINQMANLFKGKYGQVLKQLETQMQNFAQQLQYENAHAIKEQIDNIRLFQNKSSVVSEKLGQIDACAAESIDDRVFINYLQVNEGIIIFTKKIEIVKQLDESIEDILLYAITELRLECPYQCNEIVCNIIIQHPDTNIQIWQPQSGDKLKLLNLSIKNALYHKQQYIKQKQARNAHTTMHEVLMQIQKDFRLNQLPIHIECFDNSNFQGADAVSAVVVFKNAKPSKRDYRIMNVKSVEGPNDFATMEEAVYRRYRRMLQEGSPLPQLIVIDGGKGQLSSAMKSLIALGISNEVAVVGIAKQLEEIFFPNDPIPLYIDKKSISLKIIQQLRNEAHRFGISKHRNKRSKNFTTTELIQIDGIGDKTVQTLLQYFKSVKKIKEATPIELQGVIGEAKSKILTQYFESLT